MTMTFIVPLLTIAAAALNCDVLGGGAGYQSAVRAETFVTATTFQELKNFVDGEEQYIFIPSHATIEVPNQRRSIVFKEGQTIFSDRGKDGSAGGLLKTPYVNEDEGKYAVYEVEKNVRISGLRIEGPINSSTTQNKIIGLQFKPGTTNIEVDNCDIYNWSWAGVSVKKSKQNKVHHNYFHDNKRNQLGYGVVTQNGNAEVEIYCNVFNRNRHAIAGKGDDGESYHAHDNLIMPCGTHDCYHQFDMHLGAQGHAGESIKVNDNIIDYGAYGTMSRVGVAIRGVPTAPPVEIRGNIFSHAWTISRTHRAVEGPSDALPDTEKIRADNKWDKTVSYRRNEDGTCVVHTDDSDFTANCAAIGK